MPANNSIGLDEDQYMLPSRPEPPQYHPKQFVQSSNPRSRIAPLQGGKLLPKGHVLQEQIAASTKRLFDKNEEKPEQA
jgi:hypothetical protein